LVRLEVRNIFVISLSCLIVLSLFTMFTEQAFAVTIQVVDQDNGAACDTLDVPDMVDELGTLEVGFTAEFPADELISSGIGSNTGITQDSCTPTALPPGSTITVVSITNTVIPARSFSDLWYVVDDGTVIHNFDGGVSPANKRAFKIDSVGVHQPLLPETGGTQAGVFEPGETWEFILNSYSGAGAASAFGSAGVPSSGLSSTGSIIATPIEKGGTVGGVFIGIDKTAVLLAGAQMTSAWLIPIIVASIGIGIVLARKF